MHFLRTGGTEFHIILPVGWTVWEADDDRQKLIVQAKQLKDFLERHVRSFKESLSLCLKPHSFLEVRTELPLRCFTCIAALYMFVSAVLQCLLWTRVRRVLCYSPTEDLASECYELEKINLSGTHGNKSKYFTEIRQISWLRSLFIAPRSSIRLYRASSCLYARRTGYCLPMSVCPSVCLSVQCWHCVKTNGPCHIFGNFGGGIILVFFWPHRRYKIPRETPQRGR